MHPHSGLHLEVGSSNLFDFWALGLILRATSEEGRPRDPEASNKPSNPLLFQRAEVTFNADAA